MKSAETLPIVGETEIDSDFAFILCLNSMKMQVKRFPVLVGHKICHHSACKFLSELFYKFPSFVTPLEIHG